MSLVETTAPIRRVSNIYEKVCSPEGDGFSGFTIYYDGDVFTNHIEFFTGETHSQVCRQVEAAHADTRKRCQTGQPQDK